MSIIGRVPEMVKVNMWVGIRIGFDYLWYNYI